MNRTKIPWADWTWNPIVGCSPASEGCAHCYAAAISKRFGLPWGEPHFMPERLGEPAKVLEPGRVFVCSMADLGHEGVDPDWRWEVDQAMGWAPWHTYIVLTKRPGAWLREITATKSWVGVTIESQRQIDRWPTLWSQAWPSATKFVSVEPMLGPVTFEVWDEQCGPDWVIAGPETGPGARPCEDEWIERLAAESRCFFDKRKVWTRREWPVGGDARQECRAAVTMPRHSDYAVPR
jgi:protein gp37